MRVWRIVCLLIGSGVAFAPTGVSAQTALTGAIAGVVKDTSGAVLPGVTVEAASPALIEKVRTVVTDDQGQYKIVDLRPGLYSVTFTLPGFGTFRRDGIELESAFTATVSAEMKIGDLQETVTVSGAAPIVDTQNVMTREVFSKKTIEALPVGTNTGMYASLIPAAKISVAGAQTGGVDVGGTQSERSTSIFAVHGGTTDMKVSQDGMQFTRGAGGITTWSINRLAAQEVNIQVGGITAESETGGIQMNIVPKEGANIFSGSLVADGTTGDLQSDNITDELRARGVTGSPTVRKVYNLGGGTGGPLRKDRLWFFGAVRKWDTEQWLPGKYYNSTQGTPVYTQGELASSSDYYRSEYIRVTWQASQRNKINFTYDHQANCNCLIRLIAENRAPEATGNHSYPIHFPQTTWSYPATNRLLFEGGWAWLHNPQDNLRVPGVNATDIAIIETSTNFRYNARGDNTTASGAYGHGGNDQANQRFAMSYVTGSHNFKTGVFMQQLWTDSLFDVNGGMTYNFRDGVPLSVIQFATPDGRKDRGRNFGLYLQDQWTMKRLTLNLGVRYDQYSGYVPEQDLPAGPFVGARHFDETEKLLNWKDINPRAGLAYDLFGNGRTAVKAFVGRYVVGKAGAGPSNPAAAIVLSATRTWTDINRDFVPQTLELGPLSNTQFGNPTATNLTVDRDVNFGFANRDYTWQTSASIAHELRQGVAVDVGYFRTWYGNLPYIDNTLVTSADFDPYCITAPVDARLPGGVSGSQICGLYDVKPGKFGQVQNLQGLAGDRRNRVFNGVDINLNTHFGAGGMLAGGVALGDTLMDDCGAAVDNPAQGNIPIAGATPVSSQRYCRTEIRWADDIQFKLFGAYPLPWGLQASANFQSLPGVPILATYVATSAEIAPSLGRSLSSGVRGTSTLELFEPYTVFEKRTTMVDLRFSKRVTFGGMSATANFDLYNAFNAATIQAVNSQYGPTWLNGLNVLSGRLLRIGGQFDF